jgi:hypothetical protein
VVSDSSSTRFRFWPTTPDEGIVDTFDSIGEMAAGGLLLLSSELSDIRPLLVAVRGGSAASSESLALASFCARTECSFITAVDCNQSTIERSDD